MTFWATLNPSQAYFVSPKAPPCHKILVINPGKGRFFEEPKEFSMFLVVKTLSKIQFCAYIGTI